MIFDAKTRETYPEINKFFPGTDNVSGSFNGLVPASHVRGTHINPNQSVKLTHDKAKLLELLAQRGAPVPKHVPVENLMPTGGEFSILDLEDYFGQEDIWSEQPFQLRTNSGSTAFHDCGDVLDWLRRFNSEEHNGTTRHDTRKHGVFMQPSIIAPKVASVTAIPSAEGIKLRKNGDFVKNGVISEHHNLPPELLQLAKKAIDDIGLDYGTATVLYDPKEGTMELIDVDTRLRPAYAEPLYNYIQLQQSARKK